MQVTVLGSGIPVSDLPNLPNRFPPGYWVEWKGGHLLFEVSEGVRFRLQQIGVRYATVEHIAITHTHADHYALPHFLQTVYCHKVFGGQKRDQLHLYAPDTIVQGWPALFKTFVPEAPAPNHSSDDQYQWPKLVWHKMSAMQQVRIGNAVLRSAKVRHSFGRCEALAFRLQTPEGVLAYSGDTGDCDGMRKIAAHADLFVCEASARIGSEDNGYGHLTPRVAGAIARHADVQQLLLTHYSGLDSDEAMIADCRKSGYTGKIEIAKDFQELNFPSS